MLLLVEEEEQVTGVLKYKCMESVVGNVSSSNSESNASL